MPSRIGKKIIKLKDGTQAELLTDELKLSGPLGSLYVPLLAGVIVEINDDTISCKIDGPDTPKTRAVQGLIRSLIDNAAKGVYNGWEKKLEVIGVGYKAVVKDDELELYLGLSRPLTIKPMSEIKFTVSKNIISISGIDKQKVGNMAATIRKLKKPEPYKGKGIRYLGEQVRRKAGKAAKAIGATS